MHCCDEKFCHVICRIMIPNFNIMSRLGAGRRQFTMILESAQKHEFSEAKFCHVIFPAMIANLNILRRRDAGRRQSSNVVQNVWKENHLKKVFTSQDCAQLPKWRPVCYQSRFWSLSCKSGAGWKLSHFDLDCTSVVDAWLISPLIVSAAKVGSCSITGFY